MKQINFYMLMVLVMMVQVIISILISVAFLTLMERKFLGYIQMRKGPNKLGFIGLVQPFSDAIKLLTKEINMMNKMNFIYYLISPIFMLVLVMMMWMIYSFSTNYVLFKLGLIYLMCCFSLGVYGLMISGWSSNSSYSMLGAIRSLAQSISYEVNLSIIMMISMLMLSSFNFSNFQYLGVWFGYFMWPISLMFLFSIMAELNRTPFDFAEGESELVSGFNVEYSSVGFVLIFLSEYSSIMFLSMLYCLFYLGGDYTSFLFYLKVFLLSMLIIWVRGTLPRFRYDLLMYLCWLIILPFSLNYMIYMIFFKIMMFKYKKKFLKSLVM